MKVRKYYEQLGGYLYALSKADGDVQSKEEKVLMNEILEIINEHPGFEKNAEVQGLLLTKLCYYNREKEINYLLNNFTSAVYNPNFNLQNIKSYKQMNEIRMKLKKLFDQQGDITWKKSAKRRRVYDEQLSKFKVVYTRWKSETYITYFVPNGDILSW